MAEEEKEEQPKQGGGKGLIIALIALVVLLFIAVGVGGYFLYSEVTKTQSQNNQEQEEKSEEEKNNANTVKASIEDLVLNITDSKGREKLMKLSFTIDSTEQTIEALVEENRAEIVDAVISQISARTSQELLTVGGKELLKEELIEEMNRILNKATATNEDIKKDMVVNIYFTAFVIK